MAVWPSLWHYSHKDEARSSAFLRSFPRSIRCRFSRADLHFEYIRNTQPSSLGGLGRALASSAGRRGVRPSASLRHPLALPTKNIWRRAGLPGALLRFHATRGIFPLRLCGVAASSRIAVWPGCRFISLVTWQLGLFALIPPIYPVPIRLAGPTF